MYYYQMKIFNVFKISKELVYKDNHLSFIPAHFSIDLIV